LQLGGCRAVGRDVADQGESKDAIAIESILAVRVGCPKTVILRRSFGPSLLLSRQETASPALGLPPPVAAIGTIGVESLSHAAKANIAKSRPQRRREPIVDGSADMHTSKLERSLDSL
jgi:hypothetical protein